MRACVRGCVHMDNDKCVCVCVYQADPRVITHSLSQSRGEKVEDGGGGVVRGHFN